MYYHLSIKTLLVKVVIVLVISGVIGYFFDHVFLTVSIAAIFLLFRQYQNLFKLVDWLWHGKSITPPRAEGLWGGIYDGLYQRIRKHRRKQKKLNNRIREFKDGAEALPDAVIVLNKDLSIVWGNKKAHSLIGIRFPGDIGLRIDNLIRTPEFVNYIYKGSYETPCVIVDPLNVEVKIELRIMQYGRNQLLLIARDISKLHRLEEMRRDFVANVSHELKTPLTVVRGYVEMLTASEDIIAPHWQKAYETIETQVTRMDRLVGQLLTLSRVENTDETENFKLVDLSKLINSIVDDAQWLNQDKQHKIIDNISPDIAIQGLEHELKSACSNLVSNAINYTAERGEITISLSKDSHKITFSVKDTGSGIRPTDVNRLTERFFRVDKSRSRDTGGSGLGLAIVKHVVNHHNAELSIQSQWQKGSEFKIHFPL